MVRPHDAADVVIVGAGAAGSVFAAKLAAAGKRVVVLEGGPPWTNADLCSSQIWARRLKWGGAPVLSSGKHPIGHNFVTGTGFGGAALHHYAGWPRLHPEDFRLRSLYGRGRDWPISYDELRPWYDRVQSEVGISGNAVAEVWRPPGDPYPLPPLKVFRQGEILARGFQALGIRTAPSPAAILSEAYRGRPACVNDGWCDAGCPIQALANPLATYLPQAEAAGARFQPYSTVARVLADNRNRATGVEYFDAEGKLNTLQASVVVLAAAATQNARILLNSMSSRQPRGFANSSEMIGKSLMAHSIALLYGMFDEDTECHMGTGAAQLISQDDYAKQQPGRPFGSNQWLIGSALKPNDLIGIAATRPDIIGQPLHDFMARAARHMASMSAVVECVPDDANRIELAKDKDGYGLPLARLVHTLSDEAMALWTHTVEQGKAIFKAAGSREYWSAPPVFTHIAGGTVMGSDPKTSVTDSYGRCHDVGNLVVAGAGLFPSAGAVGPTYTVHALSMRTADHMLSHWSDYESK